MHPLTRLTALLLSVVLLISTIGIPVHAVYCMCKDAWEYSFFNNDSVESCCTKIESGTCCSKPSQKQTCNPESSVCADTGCSSGDCDASSTIIERLELAFVYEVSKSNQNNFSTQSVFTPFIDFLLSNHTIPLYHSVDHPPDCPDGTGPGHQHTALHMLHCVILC